MALDFDTVYIHSMRHARTIKLIPEGPGQTLAERFSSIGVPVFMADVKGDCKTKASGRCLVASSVAIAVPSEWPKKAILSPGT